MWGAAKASVSGRLCRPCWRPAHSDPKPYAKILLSIYSGLPLADGMNVLLIMLKGKQVSYVATPPLPCSTHLPPWGSC